MKNVFRLVIFITVFVSIYTLGDGLIERLMPEHDTMVNTSMLMQYGGLTGYILFIVFIVLLQEEGHRKMSKYQPKVSRILHNVYICVAVLFVLYAFFGYSLHIYLIMAVSFMVLSGVLDMIRDKVIEEHNGNALHPKKII